MESRLYRSIVLSAGRKAKQNNIYILLKGTGHIDNIAFNRPLFCLDVIILFEILADKPFQIQTKECFLEIPPVLVVTMGVAAIHSIITL